MLKEKVGTFETSGKLVVGDPCLSKRSLISLEVLPGIYHCFVHLGKLKDSSMAYDSRPWNFRVGKLIVLHEEYLQQNITYTPYKKSMDVDSGQVGIFDIHSFKEKIKQTKSVNHRFSFLKDSLSEDLRKIDLAKLSLEEKNDRFKILVKFLNDSEEKAIAYTEEEISDLQEQLAETKKTLANKEYPDYLHEEDLKTFYDVVCDLSDSPIKAGIYKNAGVNSSSGQGDGIYPLLIGNNNQQQIVSLSAKFISDQLLGPIPEFIK